MGWDEGLGSGYVTLRGFQVFFGREESRPWLSCCGESWEEPHTGDPRPCPSKARSAALLPLHSSPLQETTHGPKPVRPSPPHGHGLRLFYQIPEPHIFQTTNYNRKVTEERRQELKLKWIGKNQKVLLTPSRLPDTDIHSLGAGTYVMYISLIILYSVFVPYFYSTF